MTLEHPPNRAGRRRARTNQALVAAARGLIVEGGVASLRVTAITDAADVGRGSFYNHFASMDDLVDAVIRESLEQLAAEVIGDLPADPALGACIGNRRFIRLAYEQPNLARLFVNLANGETLFTESVLPYSRIALDRGIQAGRFRIDDVDMALIILIGSAFAVMRAILQESAPADADVLHAQSMLELFGIPRDEAAELARRPLPAAAPGPA